MNHYRRDDVLQGRAYCLLSDVEAALAIAEQEKQALRNSADTWAEKWATMNGYYHDRDKEAREAKVQVQALRAEVAAWKDTAIKAGGALVERINENEAAPAPSKPEVDRVIKVAAKDELEATYRVAIEYTVDNIWPPKAHDGESIFAVHITATRERDAEGTKEGT
jgi:hypothetical protein